MSRFRESLRFWLLGAALFLVLLALLTGRGSAANSLLVYEDSLGATWQNWSYSTTVNLNSSVQTLGTNSIAVTYAGAWGALYLSNSAVMTAGDYDALRFHIHGGAIGGQNISVALIDATNTWRTGYQITAPANEWTLVEIPMSFWTDDGTFDGTFNGIGMQDLSGSTQPTYYIDNLMLGNVVPVTPTATALPGEASHFLNIDTTNVSHAIDPNIYGHNFADTTFAAELDLPANRWGGNAVTRYNYQLDVSNRASDWYFVSIANDPLDVNALPNGSHADQFVQDNNANNTSTMLTMPLIGWTPKSRNQDCGFSTAKYGNQDSTWNGCGNGYQNGVAITGNDPTDSSIAIDETFVTGWVNHLTNNFGTAANGGVEFYSLDNEPFLWHTTHRDVHPNPASYAEMRDLTYQYAAAIKSADASAKTMGPALWGWTGYFYSALDVEQIAAGIGTWQNPPDRSSYGNTPFIEWYLQQMAAYEQTNGTRILDYVDIHYYPQQAGVTLGTVGDQTTQELRMRSTRSLWDETYVDESWINEPVRLAPRMHEWVNDNYPGTKLAISEYNFGGLEHINGAVAQADVLGIFGREQIDYATLWDPPASNLPGAQAFRMYRNYDGTGSKFGENSLTAVSTIEDDISVFAARRSSDNAITLIVVNKTWDSVITELTLAGYGSGSAETFRYSGANTNSIVQEANISILNDVFEYTFPGQSITLFDIPADGVVPTPEPTATNTPLPSPTPLPTTDPFQPVTSLATSDINVSGPVNGAFGNTHANDSSVQIISEFQTGGKPSNRRSYMEKKWTFNVTPADTVTFNANIWADASSDNDQFVVAYSTDDSNYIDMFTIAANSDTGSYQTFTLPNTLSGTVYVRVVDTDQTNGNSAIDKVTADHLYILSEFDVVVTPPPTATSTPLPTATNTPLPTATNTPLPTATNTPLPTATNTPLPTATNTPLPPTPTNTPPPPTPTNTPVPGQPAVTIPTNVTGHPGESVTMPLTFTANDNQIASMAFSLDYDQSCLSFDSTDANNDGLPDAISLAISAAFQASVTYDSADTDGEIDFYIADLFAPLSALTSGQFATVTFQSICTIDAGSQRIAAVNLAGEPPLSFGDINGNSVAGSLSNGSVQLVHDPNPTGTRSDCNGDSVINVADVTATGLEIFDNDGAYWLNSLVGSYAGSSVGCDANEDTVIDSGDISCSVLRVFDNAAVCGGAVRAVEAAVDLVIAQSVSGEPGEQVAVPVAFAPNGNDISSVAFSIDFDQVNLIFDPTDGNNDGIPDSISLTVPAGYNASVSFDPTDTDGEIDILIADFFPPYTPLTAGILAEVGLIIDANAPLAVEFPVAFSSAPSPSFGTTSGASQEGLTTNGSVVVNGTPTAVSLQMQQAGHSVTTLMFVILFFSVMTHLSLLTYQRKS